MAITIKATTGTPASTGYMVYTDAVTGTFKKALFSALPISTAVQTELDDLQDQIDNIDTGGGSSDPGTVITFTTAIPFTRANTIMSKALTADIVLTENTTGQLPGAGGTIRIVQDITPRTVTFPAGWIELAGSEGLSSTAGMMHQVLYYFNNDEVTYSISQLGITTTNFPPEANSVAISGTVQEGETLTGTYTYADVNGDTEGTSLLQWYRADSNIGTGRAAISGATSATYELQLADVGKYIQYGVTPVATTGTTPGTEGVSSYTSIVLAIGANQPPVASSVAISGTAKVGQTLTGAYTYSDNESDAEGATQKQWYRADNGSGLNRVAISGATNTTYVLLIGDLGKFIQYSVTPVAATGTSPGSTVNSSYTTAVLENVAPTVVSREATDANTIVVTYDEIVTAASSAGNSFNNGGALNISGMTGSGTTALTFTITETMTSADTITHTYSGTVVKDVALNNLAAFTTQAVTNSIGGLVWLDFAGSAGMQSAGGLDWEANASGATYGYTGKANKKIAAGTGGRIMTEYDGTAGSVNFGLNTANVEVVYTGMEVAFAFGPLTSPNVLYIEGFGAIVGGAVTTATIGNLYCIHKVVVGGGVATYTIEESSDGGLTWGSPHYTYVYDDDVDLWVVADCYGNSQGANSGLLVNPQGENVV